MLVHNFVLTVLFICSNAAPTSTRRNVTTASERLGLTWLGSNTTLPKVL